MYLARGQKHAGHHTNLSAADNSANSLQTSCCINHRASDRVRNPIHKVQGSEMLFPRQGGDADSSRRQWVQHSPGSSTAGGGISETCLPPSTPGRDGFWLLKFSIHILALYFP